MEAFDHSYTCRAIEEFGERFAPTVSIHALSFTKALRRKAPTSDSLSRKRQLERTHK